MPRYSIEAFQLAFNATLIDLKGLSEAKQRKFDLKEEELEIDLLRNIVYLLCVDDKITVINAVRKCLDQVNNKRLRLASEEELILSNETFKERLYTWLRSCNIPFTTKPPIVIPSAIAERTLQPFKSFPDFFLSPDIPQTKLVTAVASVNLDEKETVSALIDCTFWGSANDCVLVGTRAIYFNNMKKQGFLPFSDFPERTFGPISETLISLGGNLTFDLTGSNLNSSQLMQILDQLKKEAIDRECCSVKQNGIANLAGMPDLKKLLLDEVVAPLREPEKFQKYGITIPNGILLYGPPGCGKTFVAQRMAGELNRSFYEVGPSAVGSPYNHESVLMIQQLFDAAAASAPSLMFVDEFEGMVPARSGLGGEQQYKAEEVSEWLMQIGSCAQRGILFVAATNEPWSIDPAVQRSGRLDKKIYVGPPDEESIRQMLLFHLKGRITAVDIEVGTFARQIAGQGYSSSDLKLMVDEAAKIAMRVDLPIRHEHLEAAAADSVPPSISDEVMARFAELKKEVIRRNHVIKKSGLSDLAGMSELKQMLLDEVVAPLLDPDKFRKYGITIPNGILMYGPPGCGKTFVAQRLAEELNRNFYEVGPSAVGSIYMHGTGLKIRQHFDAAAASAPSLMFVDEFEGMVPARSGLGGEQQYKAEEVSEWLMQIGSCAERGILLVAATNEPWSIDTAVQRSGRLDKKIYVGPPDEASIMQMLQFHLKERLTAIDIELGEFSQQIAGQGYAASDIKLLVDEAAKIAMLKHLPIRHEHLETAAAEKVPPSISDEAVAEFTKFTSRGANSSVHPWRSPKSGHL